MITFVFGITLENGTVHVFESGRIPRYWKSVVMQRLPYGTSVYRGRWIRPVEIPTVIEFENCRADDSSIRLDP